MADYPRLLSLDEETEERLKSYLDDELTRHYMERDKWVQNIINWQRDYWAEPSQKQRTFPFLGASNIMIPLSAIAVEAIQAREMTTIFALDQFVSARAKNADWENVAHPVEAMLDHELLTKMKIYWPVNDMALEKNKFGTCMGKSGYEKIVKTAIREIGDQEQEFDVIIKDGPTVDYVPITRFLMPLGSQDPQRAPWCGEEHDWTPFEVKGYEDSGMFREGTMEKLKAWVSNSNVTSQGEKKAQHAQEKLEDREAMWPKSLNFVEMWLTFNVDQGDRDHEIIAIYHRESRYLPAVRYNYHHDLHRPYRRGVYFPVEGRWPGIGICKQNEQFQKEITTQHRQRLDNATLANMRMIVINKLSGYGPNEPVFPGKIWFVDDMSHINTIQLGEVYQSAFANEQATLIYSQQRTHVSDITLGMGQTGTPGTATSDLARIQEGAKISDFTFKNFKQFLNELIIDVAVNIQQFGPRSKLYYEQVENGKLVEQFFSLSPELIRDGLVIELTSAGQQQNKIIDRQDWIQISALLEKYYRGLVEMAQVLQSPELIQSVVKKGMTAITEAMRQILESYDRRNINRIIMSELLAGVENGTPSGPQALPLPGANNRIASPGSSPGMDQLIAAIQGNGGSSVPPIGRV
jgi:hypothetical protein